MQVDSQSPAEALHSALDAGSSETCCLDSLFREYAVQAVPKGFGGMFMAGYSKDALQVKFMLAELGRFHPRSIEQRLHGIILKHTAAARVYAQQVQPEKVDG